MSYAVNFYRTAEGRQPAREFIKAQSAKMRAKIGWTLSLLEEFGVELRMPYSEHLEDGIFQLRAQAEGEAARVLYFFVEGQEIILTNGFMKKTAKTPPEELELAKKYRAEQKEREGDEGAR